MCRVTGFAGGRRGLPSGLDKSPFSGLALAQPHLGLWFLPEAGLAERLVLRGGAGEERIPGVWPARSLTFMKPQTGLGPCLAGQGACSQGLGGWALLQSD